MVAVRRPCPRTIKENSGIVNLLSRCRAAFRTPENLNHYSEPDLKAAEKKFLKYALFGRETLRVENTPGK
jgi:hypothetical protein